MIRHRRAKEYGSRARRCVLATLAIAEGWTAVAEIGVWKAGTPVHLLPLVAGLSWVGIDPYAVETGAYGGRDMEALFLRASARIAPFADRAKLIRSDSLSAAASFDNGHFDAVYIDANHDYEHVAADIAAWQPKARRWLLGHDINLGGVRSAVKGRFGTFLTFPDRTWGVRV